MEAKEYIAKIRNNFPMNKIKNILVSLKDTKIIVIGDTIIDEYQFTMLKGRAIKDPIMSVDYVSHETYAGGILAIANHISHYVNKLSLVSLLGDNHSKEDYIRNILNKNISCKFFIKKDSPTTTKIRFIDHLRNNKLFKIEYINDAPISKELEKEIIEYLKEELPKYDMAVIGDFGHGLLNENLIRAIEKYARHISLNVQTNSSNYGFNFITKYKHVNFASMDETELKLALTNRYDEVDKLIDLLRKKISADKILVTMGSKGCVYTNSSKIFFKAPILTYKVVDTVGAGDAVFSIASLLAYKEIHDLLIPFISNCVGGIAVNILGNKESVSKEKLLNFIERVYNGMEPI